MNAADRPRSAGPRVWRRRVLIAVGIGAVAVVVIVVARLLRADPAVDGFVTRYAGTVPTPEGTPVGFPAWLSWLHFLNTLFLVLTARAGLQLRAGVRPTAYWSRRRPGASRIGLPLWFHLSADVLWVTCGVLYVVLLFATGYWARIVPTSWDVFPNAVSAAIQYASFDWPADDGWASYNSLQQLAYFTTVFIAAPLAILTGLRMSPAWPAKARLLTRVYPIGIARRLHFPVLLYFIAFVAAHLTLVLTTGVIRNLNMMYAGRDEQSWVGPTLFVASLVVVVLAVLAARPPVLRAVASTVGTVSR